MKVKVCDLKGLALNWAIAKCEAGDTINEIDDSHFYSTNWALAGPIIEREGIGLERDDQGIWFASYDLSGDCAVGATGSTPLIAAMRLFVTKELDALALDVPDNLM